MAEIQKKILDEDQGNAWSDDLPFSENITPTDRICPACEKGHLYYDHFLNLICDECGYLEASCFT
jgi:ribosomal protein S27AE